MMLLLILTISFAMGLAPEQRSDHWLVIVHSSKEAGVPPKLAESLAAEGITPDALNSSRYKKRKSFLKDSTMRVDAMSRSPEKL